MPVECGSSRGMMSREKTQKNTKRGRPWYSEEVAMQTIYWDEGPLREIVLSLLRSSVRIAFLSSLKSPSSITEATATT